MITCSYDYLTDDWNHKSFILYAFICNYVMPMITVIFFYSQIVKAVVCHEAALRKQAEKMNVESLRSNAVRYLWVLTTSSLNEDKGIRFHKRGNVRANGRQGCVNRVWNLFILLQANWLLAAKKKMV